MDASFNYQSEDDLDEEDYEEHPTQIQESVLCRILDLKYLENFSYSLIVDEKQDSLQSIRRSLNPKRRETLLQNSSFILDQNQEVRFFVLKEGEIHLISYQDESLMIRDLIDHLGLANLIQNEKLDIFLNKEDPNDTFVAPDPNEIIREFVQVSYSANSKKQQKIFIGKLEPDPELTILNSQGEEEWPFKLKELTVDDVGVKTIQLSYSKINATYANVFLEFLNSEKKFFALDCISFVLNKVNNHQISQDKASRNYYVKKVNRFGIKQKRILWFEYLDCSFHISEVDKKNHKSFSMKLIKKFLKKSNLSNLNIEFCPEANYKTLNIIFSNDEELNEFLQIAQKMQASLRETKFQAKQSVIFAQDVAGLKSKRRFSWLNLQNSQEASLLNEKQLFNYNVLVLGRVSQEKRYLVLDNDSALVFLFSKERKMLKKYTIENLGVKFYCDEPCKLELLSPKGGLEVLFASVYMKYHFTSHIFLNKLPEKVIRSEKIRKVKVSVFTLTWNLGQKAEPSGSTLDMMLGQALTSDIITLGFQECGKINVWLKELSFYLENRGYCLISYISMWDMFIVSYTKSVLLPSVSEIKTSKKPTGIANIIGNKGGVLIAFRLEDTSYCFLSCHLAARHPRIQMRAQNTRDLLLMHPGSQNLEFTVEFDYIFWIGDLNYRVDENFFKAVQLIEAGLFEPLMEKDQLVQQMTDNKNLSMFKEPAMRFKPTYRCFKGTQEWSNKREQTPSWTDRVLFKGYDEVIPGKYDSIPHCYGSDHRPVFCFFETWARHWFVPFDFPLENNDIPLGIIEIQSMNIRYLEETHASHAMVTFHSSCLEGAPKSSQVLIGGSGMIQFDYQSLPVLTFIFANPDVLKSFRINMALWLIVVDSEVALQGNSSLLLKDVVEFIGASEGFDYKSTFETNRTTAFNFDLEFGTRVVGEITGRWTFNVCRKSDLNRKCNNREGCLFVAENQGMENHTCLLIPAICFALKIFHDECLKTDMTLGLNLSFWT